MTVIELLRHAGAKPRQQSEEPDDRRPLDEAGQTLAHALVADLEGEPPVARIVSSPALRCTQTVEPLARALDLEIHVDARLAETGEVPVSDDGDAWVAAAWKGGRALALVDDLAAASTGGRYVLCSHGDCVPSVVALLAGRDGLALTEVRCPAGGRFTLTFDGGRCIGAAAVAPPRVGARR